MSEKMSTEDCTVVRFSGEPSTVRIENLKRNNDFDKTTSSTTATTTPTSTDGQKFGLFYVICIALSIVTYVFDLVLACFLLYFYTVNGNVVYFALTLTFIVVPALFITAFSLRWYIVDYDDPSLGKVPLWQWTIRIIFLLLQVSPLLRYIDTLVYGIRSNIAKRTTGLDQWYMVYYKRMLDEDTNAALLRLFHCFLFSGPQAVIQLTFLIGEVSNRDKRLLLDIDLTVLQAWTVLAALMSIGWSLTSYHRSVRYSRDDKEKIGWTGVFIAFCWHLMSALSRVLALGLLASVFPIWMGVICALHWGMMATWLALGQHQSAACSNRCEELLLSTALGLAYVLAFISPRDGPTRYVYLAYYLVCFMENTGALVVWCVQRNSNDNPELYYGAVIVQVASFLLAIVFMLIYYRHCHPSTANRSKVLQITDPGCSDYDPKLGPRRSCS
ncbi:XK-related protein 6-like [Onthophagus taurus]|uniref:XK-related protein 6-like n=1 Tax=Onthophagus taurus TaxID=166361 RepID=UPI000C20311C|nr:XK-related protein 6-like [Onthophagus taurus]